MKILFYFSLIVVLELFQASSVFALTEKPFVLVARSGFYDGFQLPKMSFPVNSSPSINNEGWVSFSMGTVDGQAEPGLWVGHFNGQGGIVYKGGTGEYISDPTLNSQGESIFEVFDERGTKGIFGHNPLAPLPPLTRKILSPQDVYGTVKVQDSFWGPQGLYFKGRDYQGRQFVGRWKKESGLTKYAEEGGSSGGQEISYLFSPVFNNRGDMAFKVRMGQWGNWEEKQEDQILLITAEGNTVVVARDTDGDPQSRFKSFSNGVSLNDLGQVAFVARSASGKEAIYLFDGTSINELVSTDHPELSEIELFTPALNNKGELAFRGKNKSGIRKIFYFSENKLMPIIGEGDLLDSDKGPWKIYYEGNHPGFGGNVDLNDEGSIVFSTSIYDPKDPETTYSKAIYVKIGRSKGE